MKKALCSACIHCSMSPQSRGVKRCSSLQSLVFIQDQGVPVRDHVQPRWPSQSRTNWRKHFLLRRLLGHLCLPGILTSLLKSAIWEGPTSDVPQRGGNGKLQELQFMKALTRIVWRVVGRRTSLRLVQCTKANSGISSTWALQRSIFSSSRQLDSLRGSSDKIGTIQRRLAWPLRKDDTHFCHTVVWPLVTNTW